ncbi:MAG TPA: S4 domain-containing protein [Xanthomonadales bacterium]|nr:S4 domain-containing protein [Xanthomonadales bacterium]
MSEAAPAAGVRIDVWLWAARWFRTRSLAKQAVVGGKVAVNGQAAKPAKAVHVGDRLVIERSSESWDVEVLALADERGSATVAQALYRETDASREARAKRAELSKFQRHVAPPSRPDKQDRRELRKLKLGET